MAIDKSKLLKSAEKLIASGKVSPAIDEYLKILKENPKDWNLMIQIGDLYLKINKTPEAIEYFQRVADHYNADGFFLKAIAIYKRINKLDPNFTEVCMKLADLYLKQGLTMDAKTQLQAVAQHYMSKNQTRDAIQTLKKLIDIEPDNLRSRNELAKAYKNEGMLAEAIQEYLEISDELTRKNLLKESLAVLETAFKLDSRNTGVLRKILAVYSEQNEMAKGMALLEDALRTDPNNPHVLALLAESYAGKNQFERAHQAIDQAIAHTTDKEPFWIGKGDLFMKEGDLISAFEQYEQVVDRMARRREQDKAITLLQKVTKADPSFHPALQKMLEYYQALRQETNVTATYNSLIDAYISKTMYAEAADCLENVIKLEPENAQHQEKLEFVRSFLGKLPSAPVAPKKIEVHEPAPVVTPEPEVAGEDFELDISLDLGQLSTPQSPPSQVEDPTPTPLSLQPTIPAQPPPPPPPPPQEVPPPASASAETTEEEKEFVSEHLIEAEVFTKYGLIDKAIEQLHIITSRYPNSVLVHQKLKEIYLEKGDRDRAVEECVVMSRIFRKQGDLDQAEDLLSEARQINPNHPSLDRAYKEMPAAVPVGGAVQEAEPAARERGSHISHPAKPAQPEIPKAPPVIQKPVAPSITSSGSLGSHKDLMGEIEKLAMEVKSRPAAKTAHPKSQAPPSPAPVPEPPSVPEIIPHEVDIELESPVGEPVPESVGVPPQQFEEVDFYISQGLMSEAHRLLESLNDKYPDDPGVLQRMSQFTQQPVHIEHLAVPEEPPAAESQQEDLMNVPVAEEAVNVAGEESLFAQSSEESEIAIGVPDVAAEEQSLEDLPALSLEDQALESPVPEAAPIELPELIEAEQVSSPYSEAPEPSEPGELLPQMEDISMEGLGIEEPAAERAEPPVPNEQQYMGAGDFGELSMQEEMQPAVEMPSPVIQEQNPFEGNVSDEPASEAGSETPVEFGEAVEIAEHVVEASPQEASAAELEFPVERSLDDALDAAFQEDEEPAEESKPVQAPQDLFEEEEDFFDLAAELEEGFLNVQSAVEEDRPADGQNYSIEEILTDFKKGVEKQLGAEDYDTRYNLGIAYKEMGLVDEAIAEFQIASKDEKRFLECCSMLGLCFVEKGMPKLALKWYQRGLETRGYSEEEYLGLRFEMGQAYEALGEEDKALECFQDVYGANAGYRNVSKKIKDLQQQLKNK